MAEMSSFFIAKFRKKFLYQISFKNDLIQQEVISYNGRQKLLQG